jgi:hypothetical protein
MATRRHKRSVTHAPTRPPIRTHTPVGELLGAAVGGAHQRAVGLVVARVSQLIGHAMQPPVPVRAHNATERYKYNKYYIIILIILHL